MPANNHLIEEIRYFIQNEPLPGDAAHLKMCMTRRSVGDWKSLQPTAKTKICAVTVLLLEQGSDLVLPLIQRPVYAGVHSGQISFPGGKKDPEDPTLLYTALRELYEEIGVKADEEHVLGALTDIYIPPSDSLVTPYLVYIPQKITYQPDEREVVSVIDFKLRDFWKPEAYKTRPTIHPDKTEWITPYYSLQDKEIWGATSMIISELKEIISHKRPQGF